MTPILGRYVPPPVPEYRPETIHLPWHTLPADAVCCTTHPTRAIDRRRHNQTCRTPTSRGCAGAARSSDSTRKRLETPGAIHQAKLARNGQWRPLLGPDARGPPATRDLAGGSATFGEATTDRRTVLCPIRLRMFSSLGAHERRKSKWVIRPGSIHASTAARGGRLCAPHC